VDHSNAPLTPEGRRRLCERVDAGRAICHVARRSRDRAPELEQVVRAVGHRRRSGPGGRHQPSRVLPQPDRRPHRGAVEALRRERKLGPVQLMGLLAAEGIEIAASTVYRILVRRGISRLRDLDVSGEDLREPVVRYEWARPGDMVHVDVKKLGRIPSGGGHRVHGRTSAQYRTTSQDQGSSGRLGLLALGPGRPLPGDLHRGAARRRGSTAAGFWARALKFFRRHGIRRVRRVLSDNGARYDPRRSPWRSVAAAAATSAPSPTGLRPTPRSSGTTGPWPESGRTRRPGQATTNGLPHWVAFLDRYNYH
jgi:hypothetical protein